MYVSRNYLIKKKKLIKIFKYFYLLFAQVIRNSFFKYEIGCVTCEIDSSLQAMKDLEKLCEEVLRSSGVSIIAKDVNNDEIVGVALNMIQVRKISHN